MSETQSPEAIMLGCKCIWSPYTTNAPQLEAEPQRCGHSYLPPTAVTTYESLLVKLFLNLNALIIQRGDLEQTVASLIEKQQRSTKGEMPLGINLQQAATLPVYRCRYGKCDAGQPSLLQYLLQLVRDYPSTQQKFHALTKTYLETSRCELGELLEGFNNMMQVDFFTPAYNFKYLKQLIAQQPQLCRNLLFLWYSTKEEFRQGVVVQLQQLSLEPQERDKLIAILDPHRDGADMARPASSVAAARTQAPTTYASTHTATQNTDQAQARPLQGVVFKGEMVYMEISQEFLLELATLLQRLNTELICNWKYYHVAQGATPYYLSDINNVRNLWSVRSQSYLTSYVLLRLYGLEANPHICADDNLVLAHLQHIIDSLGKVQSVCEMLHEVSHELRLDLQKLSQADYAGLQREEQAQLMLQYANQSLDDETEVLWASCSQELARQPVRKSSILNSKNPQIQNLLYRVFAAVFNSHVSRDERKYKDRNRKLSERIYLSTQMKQRVQDCLDIVRELVNEVRRRQ